MRARMNLSDDIKIAHAEIVLPKTTYGNVLSITPCIIRYIIWFQWNSMMEFHDRNCI